MIVGGSMNIFLVGMNKNACPKSANNKKLT